MILRGIILSTLGLSFLFTSFCVSKNQTLGDRDPSGDQGTYEVILEETHETKTPAGILKAILEVRSYGHYERRFLKFVIDCGQSLISQPLPEVEVVRYLDTTHEPGSSRVEVIYEVFPETSTRLNRGQIEELKGIGQGQPFDIKVYCDYMRETAKES